MVRVTLDGAYEASPCVKCKAELTVARKGRRLHLTCPASSFSLPLGALLLHRVYLLHLCCCSCMHLLVSAQVKYPQVL